MVVGTRQAGAQGFRLESVQFEMVPRVKWRWISHRQLDESPECRWGVGSWGRRTGVVSTGNKECPAQGGMLGRVTDLDNGSSERVCGKEKRRGYGLFLTEGMQHQKRGGKEG